MAAVVINERRTEEMSAMLGRQQARKVSCSIDDNISRSDTEKNAIAVAHTNSYSSAFHLVTIFTWLEVKKRILNYKDQGRNNEREKSKGANGK